MIRRTLRESMSLDGPHDTTRQSLSVERKKELQAEEKKLSRFFNFDQLLNFNGTYSDVQNEDYNQQTEWFFYFIDIIYVATIFNISHLISKCGDDSKVYLVAASYFTIMFSTRMFFDTFTSILHANGVLHKLIFILYGLGVYCMTVNIAAVTDPVPINEICEVIIEIGSDDVYLDDLVFQSSSDLFSSASALTAVPGMNTTSHGHTYGSCRQADNFDFGFAVSFLFTRGLIFVLFFLYCTVFHQVKQAPSGGRGAEVHGDHQCPHPSHQSNGHSGQSSTAIELHTLSSDSSSRQPSRQASKGSTGTASVDREAREADARTAAVEHSAQVRKVFYWKIVPLLVSCFVMLFAFAGYPVTVVLPLVAGVEVVGDVLPEMLLSAEDFSGLKPDRHNLEERLGLMFMLVLGETMLGFLVQRGNDIIDLQTYSTLIPAYILVIAVGMQYFKNAQFPHLPHGVHPLDRRGYAALYIYLNAALSFLMLVGANGLVELYNLISDLGFRSKSSSEQTEMLKISVSLFCVWLIMLALHLLEGWYFGVIVRSVWANLTGTGAQSGDSVKEHSAEQATAQTSTAVERGSRLPEEVQSLPHIAAESAGNPLHKGPSASADKRKSSSTSAESAHAAREEYENESFRYSVERASHFPYRQHRRSILADLVHRPSSIGAGSSTGKHVVPPPLFNKRLFCLKVTVAVIHLCAYRFSIDAQYFVVVNAVVAVMPQTFEVLIEFIDLRNRLRAIKQELLLDVVE